MSQKPYAIIGVERMNSSIFVVSFVRGLSKKGWLNTLGIWCCACELLSVVQARRYKQDLVCGRVTNGRSEIDPHSFCLFQLRTFVLTERQENIKTDCVNRAETGCQWMFLVKQGKQFFDLPSKYGVKSHSMFKLLSVSSSPIGKSSSVIPMYISNVLFFYRLELGPFDFSQKSERLPAFF